MGYQNSSGCAAGERREMEDKDIRLWALDKAIAEAASGTPWERVFKLADMYTRYIQTGVYDTPVSDAATLDEDDE